MILAVFLVTVTLASLTRMLGNYKTMLGGLDWESLSEFQNLHVLLHISTMAFSLGVSLHVSGKSLF
jgi:hypothetical protein